MHSTHQDVIIVGAGISGISAAYHLQTESPGRTFMILEGRESLGGTWDLFRYPGIRSDSDMHTLGFSFKPWTRPKTIADGPSILAYLHETVSDYRLDEHMRFNSMVRRARWSSEEARWTLTVDDSVTGETQEYTCNFLMMCAGYYSYKGGHQPDFDGQDSFNGQIVHPQQWPEDLDYRDKQVVVIGSGATAVTLVPAMAGIARHVTMLQRSPTYVVSRPDVDPLAKNLRRFLPEPWAFRIVRAKNAWQSEFFYKQTRKKPQKVKDLILEGVREALPWDYDVDTHFTPSYDPWDQRLCLIPNGDLFEALTLGSASVVTDTVDHFTPNGIRLSNGEHLDADIVVTATGLKMVTLGDIDFSVDDEPVDFSNTYTYKGLAYSDVPNLVATFGFINASWTLRADMISAYTCRLLNHMSEVGAAQATPRLRPSDHDMPTRPWVDDFSSGYMARTMHLMPKQGDREPWLNTQRVSADRKLIAKAPVDDGVMQFTKVPSKVG